MILFIIISDISCLLEDLSVNENEDEKFAMLEEFKSLYAETDKEYKRYIRSEMFLSCLREVSEHPGLVPELLRDKLNRMIINTEVLESIRIKDKNGTEYNMFGLTDEDLIELQNEVLTSDEKLCIKSAVNTLLQKKCTEFRDVQSKIEKGKDDYLDCYSLQNCNNKKFLRLLRLFYDMINKI